MKYIFVDQADFGIKSDWSNIYSKKRIIGYVKTSDVCLFLSGNASLLRPVSNWETTFSKQLKINLNLK